MNHRLQVVKRAKSITNMRVLGTNHLKVSPAKELLFEGPFYWPGKVIITVENLCMRKIAFMMEGSSPDRFMITPTTGVVEPESTSEIEVMMYPNVANEDIGVHDFTMFYVVALGKVSLSSITKEWMDQQLHHTVKETWACTFKQAPQKKYKWDMFHDCEGLPTAPVIPRIEGAHIERMRMIKKLQQENAKLCEEVHWFKVKMLMEGNHAHDPRNNDIHLSDILGASLEDLFMIFGMDVNNMQFLNIRVIVVVLQLIIFFGGIMFARYFF